MPAASIIRYAAQPLRFNRKFIASVLLINPILRIGILVVSPGLQQRALNLQEGLPFFIGVQLGDTLSLKSRT